MAREPLVQDFVRRGPRAALPGQVVLVLGRRRPGAHQMGRLPGAARSRHRTRLCDRHLDRRHQRLAHRRQPAGTRWPARAAGSLLVGDAAFQRHRALPSIWGVDRSARRTVGTVMRGIPTSFTPNLHLARRMAAGVEQAAHYSTTALLRETLLGLVDRLPMPVPHPHDGGGSMRAAARCATSTPATNGSRSST